MNPFININLNAAIIARHKKKSFYVFLNVIAPAYLKIKQTTESIMDYDFFELQHKVFKDHTNEKNLYDTHIINADELAFIKKHYYFKDANSYVSYNDVLMIENTSLS